MIRTFLVLDLLSILHTPQLKYTIGSKGGKGSHRVIKHIQHFPPITLFFSSFYPLTTKSLILSSPYPLTIQPIIISCPYPRTNQPQILSSPYPLTAQHLILYPRYPVKTRPLILSFFLSRQWNFVDALLDPAVDGTEDDAVSLIQSRRTNLTSFQNAAVCHVLIKAKL